MRARGDWSSLLHFEAATGFERGQDCQRALNYLIDNLDITMLSMEGRKVKWKVG